MASAERDEIGATDPGGAGSWAELQTAEALAGQLGETGREVLWRPVWVGADPGLFAASVAVAATLLGLLAIDWAVAAGLGLVALLALWSLELGGLARPLSPLRPKRATQDVLAPDPRGSTGVGRVMLLVRADLPRRQPRALARVCGRLGELAWLVIALTLATSAGRALDWDRDALAIAQLVPAMLALALLALALAARWAPLAGPAPGWTGLDQALEAVDLLDPDDPAARAVDLAVVGGSAIGGTARVLRADRRASVACRCWEFASGAEILAELERTG